MGIAASGLPGDAMRHDQSYKALFSHSLPVRDLLRGRASDIVWRVRFRDAQGGPEWLLVLLMLEFQSGIDWFMALRVQGYAVRLYESLWRERRPNGLS